MKKMLPLIALMLTLFLGSALAQVTPEMQLERDKKSLADRFKSEADGMSCSTLTPAGRKQCVFYRDVYDLAARCARNSLTQNDLKQCRTQLAGEEREIGSKPYSWFDPQLATCREKMTATEDEFKKLLEKEKAAGTFNAADLAQIEKTYTFSNEGHNRNSRQDFFKQTNDQCLTQTDFYKAGITLINTKVAAKPKITIKKAIYGENCANVNKSKMDLASNYKKACDGKLSCSYTINAFGVDGDPAPNCAKDLVVTYSCVSGATDKTLKLDKEAHGKAAQIDCSK